MRVGGLKLFLVGVKYIYIIKFYAIIFWVKHKCLFMQYFFLLNLFIRICSSGFFNLITTCIAEP